MYVEIASDDRQSQATLQVLEVNVIQEPSLRLRVAYAGHDFRGASDQPWIWVADLGRFVDGLRAIEASGSGTAEIFSLSPGDFVLRIEATRAMRAPGVFVEVRKRQFLRGAPVEQRVSGGFELDRSALPGMIKSFVELARAQRP